MSLRYSKYFYAAGTVIHYTDTDQQDRLEQNLKQYPKLAERTVNYTINSKGFRGSDWQHMQGLMTLGCSMTFGVGVDDREIWPYLVSQQLGLELYNLGQGGSGPDTAFRLALCYIPQLRPSIVVYLEPPSTRLELFDYTGKSQILSSNKHEICKDYYEIYVVNKLNQRLNQEKNQLAIAQLCDQYKSKFYVYTWEDIGFRYENPITLARDLMHPGVEHHKIFSDKVLAPLRCFSLTSVRVGPAAV